MENPNPIPEELLEAAKKFDQARTAGKRPKMTYNAINLPEGARVEYEDDDTRREKNPYDDAVKALGGK